MQCVGDELPMKNSARDITFGEYGGLFGEFDLFQALDQFQVCRSMRLRNSFQLARHQWRDHRAVFRELVLPPADGEITPEGLAVVEIGAYYGSLEISAWLHDLQSPSSPYAFGRRADG